MTPLEERLSRACDALGLQIDLGYVLRTSDGVEIRSVAFIRNRGGREGILVFRNFDDVRDHLDRIDDTRYGFSVLSDPRREEPFDLEIYRDMFCEWGLSPSLEGLPPRIQ